MHVVGRFHILFYEGKSVIVTNLELDEFKKLDASERPKHVFAQFFYVGSMTETIAKTYATKVAEQLNSFEIANAAVIKLT